MVGQSADHDNSSHTLSGQTAGWTSSGQTSSSRIHTLSGKASSLIHPVPSSQTPSTGLTVSNQSSGQQTLSGQTYNPSVSGETSNTGHMTISGQTSSIGHQSIGSQVLNSDNANLSGKVSNSSHPKVNENHSLQQSHSDSSHSNFTQNNSMYQKNDILETRRQSSLDETLKRRTPVAPDVTKSEEEALNNTNRSEHAGDDHEVEMNHRSTHDPGTEHTISSDTNFTSSGSKKEKLTRIKSAPGMFQVQHKRMVDHSLKGKASIKYFS